MPATFARKLQMVLLLLAPTQIVDLAVSAVLALIMFGVGLTLTVDDFIRIVRYPRAFFSALSAQMLGLPILAFLINLLAPLSPALKVGFLILSASPGGATSGFLTYLWRGNVALSLSLTATNSFLTLFTIPIVVNAALLFFLGRSTDLHLPFWDTVRQVFFITIVPAATGLVVRRYYPLFAQRVSRPARYVMLTLLAVVFFIKMFASEQYGGAGLTLHDFLTITPVALAQNAASLFFGYFFLRWVGEPHPSRLTAAFECGVQNTTLAFLIASILLGSEEMVKPALVYSSYSFWTACLFGIVSNRIASQQA
ncbi:MAG: bile acid:sodium symporter family protein [Saprospiraceae bacterium]|nr:bile acid:sodium symporter family protein [Saprospiraceae bacterium]MDW8484737.1 bile acid:sodium symporter family protein [Saprospiraceae bacterium]